MSVKEAFEAFERELTAEIQQRLHEIGQEGVEYAKEHGDYHDVTGHLRASNKYEVEGTTLRLYNDADYATDVEARGNEVISGAILYVESRIKEVFDGD